jgi:hypothetical protein
MVVEGSAMSFDSAERFVGESSGCAQDDIQSNSSIHTRECAATPLAFPATLSQKKSRNRSCGSKSPGCETS